MQEQALSGLIENEYEKLIASEEKNYDAMYVLLTEYLKKVVSPVIREDSYLDLEALFDIVQESIAYIISYGLVRFEKGEALFASYCARIAKNKALDYVRKRSIRRCESLDKEETDYLNQIIMDNSPERSIMETGRQLALCEQVKKGIQILMDLKAKPYAIVASCFSLILFHKFNENTKELSSPGWAYTRLSPETVYAGADEFLEQMYSWMPKLKLRWSERFAQACKEDIDDELVGNIVFGEQFKVKDFENWSRRCKEKVKAQLEESFDEGLEL